ncbi:hypothetical protein BLNAU_13551 [Blattamonas nauphoetae]|uniref:Uncharacterized protein n=1 Tax=Blattamonas nauphoetae TaxID=2049346 RepID=A0ABQ9XII1_9EUKA|nr:hypothetical protein BLNAU_13551 [Blattamonas nauphoetae]
MKSIEFSLNNFDESRYSEQNNDAARLAVVSNSMLTITDCLLAVSPSASPILISSTNSHSSMMPSSVVIQNCSISNDVGEMRGVVETSAFPSIGGSVSVTIVRSSFDSIRVLGKDGIGLSLTRTSRKNVESVGRMSSSLIGCYFVNMSSIGCSHSPRLPHLDQKMLGCVVSLTSSHLSGSTIRDVNTIGSVLCSNSSFSSLLPSTNTDPSIIIDGVPQPAFEDGEEYRFDSADGGSATSISFSHCTFASDDYHLNIRPLTFDEYEGSITLLSCSFTGAARPEDHPDYDPYCQEETGGAVSISSTSTQPTNTVKVTSCNFTNCLAPNCGGGLFISTTALVTVTKCRCVGCSITRDFYYISGGGMFIKLSPTPDSSLSELYFEECTSTSWAGGLSVEDVESTHLITSLFFKKCSVGSTTKGFGVGGGMNITAAPMTTALVAASHLKFGTLQRTTFRHLNH